MFCVTLWHILAQIYISKTVPYFVPHYGTSWNKYKSVVNGGNGAHDHYLDPLHSQYPGLLEIIFEIIFVDISKIIFWGRTLGSLSSDGRLIFGGHFVLVSAYKDLKNLLSY